MRTRSSSNPVGKSSSNLTSSNLKRRNRRRSKQPFILEESVDTMADQRTMAELLRAPTDGYAQAIVVPSILTEHFELNHSLINMMTSDQFFGLEKDKPHDHIRWFTKITSTIKYKDEDLVSKFINEFFPPSRTTNLRNEISNFQQWFDESFHEAWDRYKDLLHACPHHGFTELHQLDTFYNALNPADRDSLNSAAGGNLLERRTQDVLTIIKNKSKIAKLTHAVNQQTSVVTTAMTAILKQFQATPPPASVKSVEEICVTYGGAHPYYQCLAADGKTFLEFRDNIQGYVSATTINYNQGNFGYRPSRVANKIRTSGFAQSNVENNQNRFSQPQGYNRGNNFNQDSSFHAPIQQNQNMMASFFQMNTASTLGSGTLPSNTIANPKGELKSITTRSGLVLDGPFVPMHPPFINPEEDECVEETLTNPKLGLPKLISTCMTLELANQAICTPTRIARDVFVPVGKFTFPADFVILDYESDPRVLIILGRLFLRTARALIDVHGEEMILRDGDERLTLNMRHDTSSYSNQPQKDSINMINIYDDSCEDYLKDLFATNHPSGNPTFSSHPDLTSPKVKDDIFDSEGDIVLIEKFLNLDSTKDLLPHNINPLSGSTTSSSPDHLLEEFVDKLALITFPPGNDDLPFDIESNLREIEYSLNHDPTKEIDSILENSVDEGNLTDPNDNLFDTIFEIFNDKHALDYSSPSLYDDFYDDIDELESNYDAAYYDPFDSKEDKIKESKLLIDELDPPRSSILIHENLSEIIVQATPDKNIKKIAISHAYLILEDFYPPLMNFLSTKKFPVTIQVTPNKNVKKISISNAFLILEDFNPPLYKLPFHKDVPSFFIIAVQTPGSGISILLAVGTPSTGSGNLYCQWELSPGSGNALCILFPTKIIGNKGRKIDEDEEES
nr:hypothetical protein [Tanacetum cinerariifolium]